METHRMVQKSVSVEKGCVVYCGQSESIATLAALDFWVIQSLHLKLQTLLCYIWFETCSACSV